MPFKDPKISGVGSAICAALLLTAGAGRAEDPAIQDLRARLSRLENLNDKLVEQNERLEKEVERLKSEIHDGRIAPVEGQSMRATGSLRADQSPVGPPCAPQLPGQAPQEPDLPGGSVAVDEQPKAEGGAKAGEAGGLDQRIQAAAQKLSWSKGEFKIVPFGWLEAQALGSTDSVTSRTVVNFVNPGSPLRQPEFNIFGQTSALGVAISGPEICGLQSGGRILTVFVGDRPLLNQSTPLLVNAYGELFNDNWRFLFGTYFPIVAPLNPDSVAFAPGLATGNLGVFRGQFRVEHYLHLRDDVQLTLQAGLTQQVVNDFVPFAGFGAIGSDNGWPNVEARVALALGPLCEGKTERPFEVGLSGLIGQVRAVEGEDGRVSDSWAVALDLRAAFTDWIGCKGETFTGQALGTYGGGISQSLNLFTGGPIRSSGGWGEVYVKPHPRLLWAAGYGIDDPLERDLGPFDRARNDYYFSALFWDVTKALNVGAEVDYRKTAYIFPSTNNEALVYYFRVRLTF